MLTVFQNTDSSPAVSTLSLTMARRRLSFNSRRFSTIDRSAPATLIDCTAPNISPTDSVICPVAS